MVRVDVPGTYAESAGQDQSERLAAGPRDTGPESTADIKPGQHFCWESRVNTGKTRKIHRLRPVPLWPAPRPRRPSRSRAQKAASFRARPMFHGPEAGPSGNKKLDRGPNLSVSASRQRVLPEWVRRPFRRFAGTLDDGPFLIAPRAEDGPSRSRCPGNGGDGRSPSGGARLPKMKQVAHAGRSVAQEACVRGHETSAVPAMRSALGEMRGVVGEAGPGPGKVW